MGSVYRPAGQKTWMLKYSRRGKVKYRSARTRNHADAVEQLKQIEGDLSAGRPVLDAEPFTFDDAVAAIEQDYRIKGQSTRNLKSRIKHLRAVFGDRLLADVTAAEIRAYQDRRQIAGAKPGSVITELTVFRRMFRLGVEAQRLHGYPPFKLKQPSNARKGFFERADFERVRAHLPEWLRGPITFAYWSGWRFQSEIARLEWRHVDERRKIVKLDPGETKNGDGRAFPYGPLSEVVEAIAAAATRRDALRARGITVRHVFTDDDGVPLVRQSGPMAQQPGLLRLAVRNRWADACKAAGVADRILHDFRRTAVRNLVRELVSENAAMQITGHKTRVVFDRYNIVNEQDLLDSVVKLAAHVVGNSGPAAPAAAPAALDPAALVATMPEAVAQWFATIAAAGVTPPPAPAAKPARTRAKLALVGRR